MIKLKTVVQQLTHENYEGIGEQFRKNRAEKFHMLLKNLRETELSEEEISGNLNLNKTAYYTLKSRLYEKIQEYLYENVKDPRIELLNNVTNIHNLVYSTPKDTAIAILRKLEKELTEYDMPNELTSVYNALKKLHLYSPKYYEYAQLYNKHVAYTIALDKAEDLLSRYTKSIGEYMVSRDPSLIELLALMKMEMANVFRLYESHHLAVYRNIMNISFALFIPGEIKTEEESVEEMLTASWKIFDENVRDADYQYLRTVMDFLAFEYYHGLKLTKNETPYFERVNEKLDQFLLADHCCFNARFLLSKLERYCQMGMCKTLEEENKLLTNEVSEKNVPSYIYYKLYIASSSYYSGQYADAIQTLNEMLNAVSLKNMLHTEMEAKLFLALNYSMVNKYEQAEILIKSVSRKLNERGADEYENVQSFIRILKLQMSSEIKDMETKMKKLCEKFVQANDGKNRILGFLKMDEAFVSELSRSIKRVKAR
jgi:hypothetical protein